MSASRTRAALGLMATTMAAALLAHPALAAADPPRESPKVDASVRPGDDFYRYANGDWLRTVVLPAGTSRYDTSAALRVENARRVAALIEDAAKAGTAKGALGRKVGDYYASWKDVGAIEAKGLAPLAPDLASINEIHDRRALAAYLGDALRSDDGTNTQTDGLFGAWIHQGFHDPDHYAVHLVQGGLGLPDREDYLDPQKAERRPLYQAHIADVLKLAGRSQPGVRAARVLALEIAIARTHASRADTDDVFKTDNPWRRADFDAKAPGMDWASYFEAAGLDKQARFVVWQPSAVIGSARLVGSESLETWKDYLAFHLIAHQTAVLPKAFSDEQQAFLGRLSGTPQSADRAQQAIAATNLALGEAVGQLYVARYYSPETKAAAAAMAENLRAAYRARIPTLTWMSPQTRDKALVKLAALKVGVGYPNAWIDYAGLVVVRSDAYGNLRRAEAFAFQRDIAKLRRRLDPAEWFVLPQTVGAVINFTPNSMQFAAGVLQPPYFDAAGDAASNYGSAGAGMAHEIGHSFDELGDIYDAQGNLGRWWTDEDLARYRAAVAPMARQFDAYCPQAGLCLRGKQFLSEDVADLVGLQVAYDAYHLSLNGGDDQVKDGLTGDQRFFLAFARRWRRVQTDAALRQQVETDTHAPGEYRADTVRNLEAWVRAFGVTPGDKLYLRPEDRVRIW